MKSLVLNCLAAACLASQNHPIRQEIVDEIKLLTTAWKPRAVEHNHLRHIPIEQIHGMMGQLGMNPFEEPAKMGTDFFKDLQNKVHAYLFGHNNNTSDNFKLTQKWNDWDVVDDDDIKDDPQDIENQKEPGERDSVTIHDEDSNTADDASDVPVEEDDKKDQTTSDEVKIEDPNYSQNWNDHFSWLNKMPECLGPIEDQGTCGACWAFTSSGFLADRFCIHSEGQIKTRLSPQEMLDCDFENFGCMGGYLITTIDYLQIEGLVSNTCAPYQGAPQTCTYSCTDHDEDMSRFYCQKQSLKIFTNHDQIKQDLKKNGPLMMGLMIYEDFLNYQSGIYRHVTGEQVGGHAMKLIGYGYDQYEGLYWLLQNQWTVEWGEQGYVKIKSGEVGIDSVALSCIPDITF